MGHCEDEKWGRWCLRHITDNWYLKAFCYIVVNQWTENVKVKYSSIKTMFWFPSVCWSEKVEGDFLRTLESQQSSVSLPHSHSSNEVKWHFWSDLIDTFSHKNKIKSNLCLIKEYREPSSRLLTHNMKRVGLCQQWNLFSRCILGVINRAILVLPCRNIMATTDQERYCPQKSNLKSQSHSCLKNSASKQGWTVSEELLTASSKAAFLKICF